MTSLNSGGTRILSFLDAMFCCEVGLAGSALSVVFFQCLILSLNLCNVSGKNLFNTQFDLNQQSRNPTKESIM